MLSRRRPHSAGRRAGDLFEQSLLTCVLRCDRRPVTNGRASPGRATGPASPILSLPSAKSISTAGATADHNPHQDDGGLSAISPYGPRQSRP